MSVQKSTYSRALPVYASDNALLANPALLSLSGENNSVGASPFELITNVDMTNLGIRAGDIVINLSTGKSATATSDAFQNILPLNADIFQLANQFFAIYQGDQNSASKSGCVLYATQAGSCRVLTLSGDNILIQGLVSGEILPIQVVKVFETDYNTSLISLW